MESKQSGLYLDLLEIVTETYQSNSDQFLADEIINIQSNNIEKYYIKFFNGECSAHWGHHPLAGTSYYGSVMTFINILRKKEDPIKSILSGKIKIVGDIAFFINLKNKFTISDNKNTDSYYSIKEVLRGPLNIQNRSLFVIFMLINLLTILSNYFGLNIIIQHTLNAIPLILILYLLIFDTIQLAEIKLAIYNISIIIIRIFRVDIINKNYFFAYNLIMLLVFSLSFFSNRTIVSFFNTININGKEYFNKKINDHQSDITLLWILLNILGIASTIIPWSIAVYSIMTMNIYLLLYSTLLIYTYIELKSC